MLQVAQTERGAAAVLRGGLVQAQLGRLAVAIGELALPLGLASEAVAGLAVAAGPGAGCAEALRDLAVLLSCRHVLIIMIIIHLRRCHAALQGD